MKGIKVAVFMAASALLLSSPAMAFHTGGVADCDGCHTMHNSDGNVAMKTTGGISQFKAGPYLLQGSTPSEACLNCHESTPGSYHISTPTGTTGDAAAPNGKVYQFTPGGDFRWLTNGGAGHQINAPAFGYNQAAGTAPGGGAQAYPASALNCSSCHDPHGKYRRTTETASYKTSGAPIKASGSYITSVAPATSAAVGAYRILGGANYLAKSAGAGVANFVADPPAAMAPSTYNVSNNATTPAGLQVATQRVVYMSGMAEWCANCHGAMHMDAYTTGASLQSNGFNVHPAGNDVKLTQAGINNNYNAYVTSGNMNGAQASSYLDIVPFETGSSDFAATKTTGLTLAGPDANSNVMCLSCHRAHASGFPSMTRYGIAYELVTVDDGTGAGAVYTLGRNGAPAYGATYTTADMQTAYYGRSANAFGAWQRDLCNKCHAKD